MSVISTLSTKRKSQTVGATREASEDDGLWINAGVMVPCDENDNGAESRTDDEGNAVFMKFVRLPRGIAVGDLKPRKIYESMDPTFAAEASVMNTVIVEIQNAARGLEEGESMPISLELVLYRRQEEANIVPDKATNKSVHQALFGTKVA